jgi:uncharacterized protein YbjT (DUF2867 family)
LSIKIAVFGPTGLTGTRVVTLALEEGRDVVALTRNASRFPFVHERLTVVEGDASSPADVRKALQGVDAIVHCLGIGGKGKGEPASVVSDSVTVILEEMQRASVSRIVCMSNVGAGESGSWFYRRVILPLFLRWLRPIIADKNVMEAALRNSAAEWVAVRIPNIVEGPWKPVRSSETGQGIGISITASSVARFLLEQTTSSHWLRKAPSISN